MRLYKPNFWNFRKNIFSIIFLPLSFIFLIFMYLRRKIVKKTKFNIPIICVGNIYVGGTGKTPLTINIAKELAKRGKKPAIVRKYYKSHKDEHNMILENYDHLILDKKRKLAINKAIENKFDAVILDDGFQDYKIKKDLNILCFNSNQLIGNGFVFPSGPLRENLSSIKNVNIVVINGEKNKEFERKILDINNNLKIYYSNYKPLNIEDLKDKKLLAVSGIGNPENFFKILKDNDLNLQKTLIYPDHYQFNKYEIQKIIDMADKQNYQIVMTEKDYYKIKDFNFKMIKYLRIELELQKKDEIIKNILKIYD